jgi:cell division septum initiation protein DivIVA
MTMKKFALGVAIAAVGVATQSIPAYADKLDDVLSRLDAIEQNNKRLAKENADLRARLNKGESARSTAPVANTPAARAASMTGVPTPPRSLTAPEIDANGHGFFEHKKGNPLTFYTPGGEITGYGNIDLSVDDTTKAFGGNINTNPAFTGGSEPFPTGNFGWLPAISSNSSYLGVRGFQVLPNFPANFVYQLEVGFDVSSTPGLKQTNSQVSENTNARVRRHQDRQDHRALRKLHRRLQSVRGPDRRHACRHGQYRRRQPRRIRRPARSLDLVRIANDRRIPVHRAVLAGPEPQQHQRQYPRRGIRLCRRQRSHQRRAFSEWL